MECNKFIPGSRCKQGNKVYGRSSHACSSRCRDLVIINNYLKAIKKLLIELED